MSEFISIYITAPDAAAADRIAHALVEERLAACVNILSGVKSVYRWQGKVETAAEVALLAKTRRALFPALEKRVKELHSYDCPCVVAWGIEAAHAPFLNWIKDETESA